MLTAALTQFRLGEDGVIRFQPNPTNPLPGEAIARVLKGDRILEPKTEVLETAGHDKDAVTNLLNEWLKSYIRQALEPLTALEQTEGLAEPVKAVCEKLYAAMGVIPREDVENFIKALDPEMRQVLRAKQIRLGPVIVFLPALNKPAGVKLRALLYALWHGKDLPPPLPHDGAVSVRVDENADREYYRAIGYPVYGPRAIRIDMLDRVINAVYDNAKDGAFQAQHKMAEWLGCPIEDLYEVLIAMGHRKLDKPPESKKEEIPAEVPAADSAAPAEEKQAEEIKAEEIKAEEIKAEEPKPEEAKAEETKPEEAKPEAAVKPELAYFQLKKGKAFNRERKSRDKRAKGEPRKPPPPDWIDPALKGEYKKPERKPGEKSGKRPKRDKKDKDRDYNKERGKHNRDKHRPTEPARLAASASAKSTPEDNPFAILGQLKKAKDGS